MNCLRAAWAVPHSPFCREHTVQCPHTASEIKRCHWVMLLQVCMEGAWANWKTSIDLHILPRKHHYLMHLISRGSPFIHFVYLARGCQGCQPPLTGDKPGGLCSLLDSVGREQAQLLEGILFCKTVPFETWKTPVKRRYSVGLITRKHCSSHRKRLFA